MILLGVVENSDRTLAVVGLDNADKIVKDFWDNINNPKKASVNILTDKNVKIKNIDGKDIVVINVPRAVRSDRPVYIDGNPMTGTYRRNGEGDYKCSSDEVRAMLRDASAQSQDMLVLENMSFEVLDFDSIHRYRQRMVSHRPGHVWEELDDRDFLYRLGAFGRGFDGEIHPTAAGLLMFGFEYEIVKEFPDYFLDYREQNSAIKIGDKKSAISEEKKQCIIKFLSENGEAKSSEIADELGLQPSRTRDYLNLLIEEGIVITMGENRNRTYRLNNDLHGE